MLPCPVVLHCIAAYNHGDSWCFPHKYNSRSNEKEDINRVGNTADREYSRICANMCLMGFWSDFLVRLPNCLKSLQFTRLL